MLKFFLQNHTKKEEKEEIQYAPFNLKKTNSENCRKAERTQENMFQMTKLPRAVYLK